MFDSTISYFFKQDKEKILTLEIYLV